MSKEQLRLQKAIAMGLNPDVGTISKKEPVVDKKDGGKVKSKKGKSK